MKTDESEESVNYQSNGKWLPINDTLVASSASGYAFQNTANAYSVDLPSSLGSPVTVTNSSGTVGYALEGASGAPTASGTTATYADALPSTTVAYDSTPDSVVDTLTLANAQAPSSFVYDVTVPSGASLRQDGGGIDVVGSDGSRIGSFSPPTISDASGPSASASPVSMALSSPMSIAVTINPSWFASPSRVWPVTVDPTFNAQFPNANVALSCTITSSTPTTSACGGNTMNVGYTGTSTSRALTWFSMSGVPQNAIVTDAALTMDLTGVTTSTPTSPIALYRVTKPYTSAATWNNYATSTAWSTAGGDYATTNDSTYTLSNVGSAGTGTTYEWDPTQLVQGWLNGTFPNDGMIFKLASEDASHENTFTFWDAASSGSNIHPQLEIEWAPRAGNDPSYTQISQSLDDKLNLDVNPATGDLQLASNDLSVQGVGQNLNLERYYNSLDSSLVNSQTYGVDGAAWTTPETDAEVLNHNDGSATYEAGDGSVFNFTKTSDTGALIPPPGLNATLALLSGNWQLTFNKTGEKYNFTFGKLTSMVDKNGRTITVTQGATTVTSMTDTVSRSYPFTFNGSGKLTGIGDTSGSRSLVYSEGTGALISFKDANLGTTTYGYDTSQSEVKKVTTPNGTITTILYDSLGRVSSFTRVTNNTTLAGNTWTFTYNPDSTDAGGNTVVTDQNGNATTYYYDFFGKVTQIKDALTHSHNQTWTANNDPHVLTDALSNAQTLSYDNTNNLSNITSQGGSCPTSTSGTGSGCVQQNTYPTPTGVAPHDAEPSSTTDEQEKCTAYTYDTAGNVTDSYSGQSAMGNGGCAGGTSGNHEQFGRQGDPGITSCGALSGEICWVKDGNTNQTSYAYFTNGDLKTVTPPSPQGATNYTYDTANRIATVTDGKSNKTTYSYDKDDRITQLLYGGTTTCSTSAGTCVQFTYDGDGTLTQRVDVTGTTKYFYDLNNRLTTEQLPSSADACSGSSPLGITLTWDGANNLKTICDANGTTTYGYNVANQLTSLAEPGGSCTGTISLCTTFVPDNNGRRTSTTFPGGAKLAVAYDNAGNEYSAIGTSSTPTTLSSFVYSYLSSGNTVGLRQSMTENDPVVSQTTNYSYDGSGELTAAAVSGGSTLNYAYDSAGNRCSTSTSCTSPTYTYNANNELTTGPTGSYTYDLDGQETSSPQLSNLTYNAATQNTSTTPSGSSAETLAYADLGQSQMTTDGTSTLYNGPLGVDGSKVGTTTTYYVVDPYGEVIGENVGGTHYYYLKDGNGSVVAVINGSGSTVSDRYSYDPYGQVTSSSGSVSNSVGYDSGWMDATTSLEHFGARWYDAKTGRWAQQDPLGIGVQSPDSGGYLFAGNDPIDKSDPSGRCSLKKDILNDLEGADFVLEGAGTTGLGATVIALATADSVESFGLSLLGVASGTSLLGSGVVLGTVGIKEITSGDC